MEDRLPPVDIEAEEAFLGSILIDPGVIHEVVGLVQPEDFYREMNNRIYTAMLTLSNANEPIDIVTLAGELKRTGDLEDIGGEAEIIRLLNVVPTSINADAYGRMVNGRALSRRLIGAASMIANVAYEEEPGKAMDQAEQFIMDLRSVGKEGGLQPAGIMAKEYMERIEELHEAGNELIGLPTGFTDLDRVLGGLPEQSVTVIAARPSMGKTALMLQIGLKNAFEGKKVAIFSLEMAKQELMGRITSTKTRIDSQRLRRGDLSEAEWPKFYEIQGKLSESGLYIDATPGITIGQIRSRCRRMAARHGLDLIMVDYLQLMMAEGKAQNRNLEVSAQSKGLKNLARELGVPAVVVSQLSRAVESRLNKHPMLSDLRDSGTIEEDADIVIFIYRDEYYNPDTTERPNIAEINVAKNRNGPTAQVDLYWHGQLATFRNLQRQELDFDGSGTHSSRTVKEAGPIPF